MSWWASLHDVRRCPLGTVCGWVLQQYEWSRQEVPGPHAESATYHYLLLIGHADLSGGEHSLCSHLLFWWGLGFNLAATLECPIIFSWNSIIPTPCPSTSERYHTVALLHLISIMLISIDGVTWLLCVQCIFLFVWLFCPVIICYYYYYYLNYYYYACLYSNEREKEGGLGRWGYREGLGRVEGGEIVIRI